MTPSLSLSRRLQGHWFICQGLNHKVPDGVKNEHGHWGELSMHKGARLKELAGSPGRVSSGDFVSVKTLWISSPPQEDIQMYLS